MASILDCGVQPVGVVDQAGVIRFANPSALGYDDVSDLLGQPSHQTIHYKRPDGTALPAEECPMLLPRTTGQAVHAEDWFVRRDGRSFLSSTGRLRSTCPAAAAPSSRSRT